MRFVELRLEDVAARLNRFERAGEAPFEAMNLVAEFNQRAYELFGRPLVHALANEPFARLSRAFHPLRLQRWGISDLNPWLWWLAPAAQAVRAQRQAVDAEHPASRIESMLSDVTSASLDSLRALRDAVAEATFFQIYGSLFALYFGGERGGADRAPAADAQQLASDGRALASIERGGYAEALARVAFLIAHEDEPLPLSRLELAHDLIEDYRALLPPLAPDEVRRIGGEQEVIARHDPERAIEALPTLLADPADRDRLLTLLDSVLADRRVQRIEPTARQVAILARIRSVLGARGSSRRPGRAAPAQRGDVTTIEG